MTASHVRYLKLVGARRLLARLELFHVPPADVHVTPVLVHAGCEVANVHLARTGTLLLHLLPVISLSRHLLLLCFRRGTAATAKEAADGVADGGTDCDTTVETRRLY